MKVFQVKPEFWVFSYLGKNVRVFNKLCAIDCTFSPAAASRVFEATENDSSYMAVTFTAGTPSVNIPLPVLYIPAAYGTHVKLKNHQRECVRWVCDPHQNM